MKYSLNNLVREEPMQEINWEFSGEESQREI